jgi:hypothetical protein
MFPNWVNTFKNLNITLEPVVLQNGSWVSNGNVTNILNFATNPNNANQGTYGQPNPPGAGAIQSTLFQPGAKYYYK